MGKSIKDKLIRALQESELVDKKRLKNILSEAKRKREGNIIKALEESGIISEEDLLILLSQELDVPPIDLSRVSLDSSMINLLPEKIIRQYSVIPLSKIGRHISLVVSDPTDVLALDDVKTVTGCDISMIVSTSRGVQEALRSLEETEDEDLYGMIGEEEASDVEVVTKIKGFDILETSKESTTAPIVKMVDLIISEAIKKKASDIHIEPQEKSLIVRYRIDGELYQAFELPKKNQNALIARIKIMSSLDITETRVPQDGRFRVKLGKKEIDFRVSVLPTVFGNKIVLRALDKGNLSVGLETLGFLPGPLEDFKKALTKPFGIILVTGPTGSGKSTTLYSVLNEMNTPDRNIVTVEDPVEYQVPGITQIATKQEIGLDFAGGLRAILRQSPDVILVGEIRDFETADIAIKASLTGQMVLSTLHTNDAVGAITRLVNMGIEPFLVASSLVMACAQRLLKRICTHCKVEEKVPDKVLEEIRKKYPEAQKVDKFFRGKGCTRCNNTGYSGRMGTLETFLVDENIKEMINKQKSEEEIRAYLNSIGAKTLRDNAMIKFIKGWTTLEEVYRVT